MSIRSRTLVACASCLVLGALAMPLWSVRLFAPQYPEGLGMKIHAGTLRGATEHDLGSINALNHYIGMKAIVPESIPELRVIPWLIGALAICGLAAALIGRRVAVMAWLASFATLGAVGLWDFYRWEYSYGHDLDFAHAIIKIPGMTYQPPLIGSKQLLNFTAISLPDVGSILLFAAFALGVVSLLNERQSTHTVAT